MYCLLQKFTKVTINQSITICDHEIQNWLASIGVARGALGA